MGLGSLDIIGLGEARDATTEARKLLLAGKDPIEERNTERVARLRISVMKPTRFGA
jgi:hypothetical protein